MKILGILHSECTVAAVGEKARADGLLYMFRGARGRVDWLRGPHACLGASGASNFFRRLCIPHAIVSERDFASTPEAFHTLILSNASALGAPFIDPFQRWLDRGGRAVVTGATNLPLQLLSVRSIEPFAPPQSSFVIFSLDSETDDNEVPVCVPGDYVASIIAHHDAKRVGRGLISRTPAPYDAVAALPGDIAIASDSILHTPIPFFDYFGALLQGHLDLPAPTAEISSLMWLDEYAIAIKQLLEAGGFGRLFRCSISPWPKPEKVVILRHDLDYTRDTTFADRETVTRTPATFSLRNDADLSFWRERLSPHTFLERNYHFDSVYDKPPLHIRALAKTRIVRLPELVQPAFGQITGPGLAKQLRPAVVMLGTTLKTAFKHGSTFCYPETVDALAASFDSLSELLGVSTIFRWNLFRYRTAPYAETFVSDYPGSPVPLWFPVRMWRAAIDDHKPLRGWDISAVNDVPPDTIDHLLEGKNSPPWGVYTFNFHPGHTQRSHYSDGGSLPWFEHLLKKTMDENLNVMTCADAFEAMNRWETLRLEQSGSTLRVVNAGQFVFESLWVRVDGMLKQVGPLKPGDDVEL